MASRASGGWLDDPVPALYHRQRGVRLTPQGAAFLFAAADVVQQADRALEVARALAEAATGQLRLSYARTMFTGLPELIVSEYQRRFPGVEITADSGTTGSNVDRLRSDEVDIAFVLTPLEDAGDLQGSTSAGNRSWSLCPVVIH